jgi:serine/threonine protein kinase
MSLQIGDFSQAGPFLGQGGYKTVHLAKKWSTGEHVALASMDKRKVGDLGGLWKELVREKQIFSELDGHPHIIK